MFYYKCGLKKNCTFICITAIGQKIWDQILKVFFFFCIKEKPYTFQLKLSSFQRNLYASIEFIINYCEVLLSEEDFVHSKYQKNL